MSRHLVTTPVKIRTCARCGMIILAGDAEGVPARVDPIPVTPLGALAAILAGRQTFTLVRPGELVFRDEYRIHGGNLKGPTLIAHSCGVPIPAEHREIALDVGTTEPEGVPF